MKNIVIIGAGNVATHLSVALYKANYNILQIYSRTQQAAKTLAKQVNSNFTNCFEEIDNSADLYIIAVLDSCIKQIVAKAVFRNKFIVHTAGSVPVTVLETISKNYGVFYPLQTFSKDVALDFSQVPICIEANNTNNETELYTIANNLNCKVYSINSKERKRLHLAAVFVNNFTNYLFTVAYNILDDKNLPFEILHALIKQTTEKATNNIPADVQTGPAKRGDIDTINKHLQMMNNNKDFQEVYKMLSNKLMEDL